MTLLGQGFLAIWNDIAPGGDAEFNHWHTREHVPERVGVPGFLRGRRYAAVSGSPAYFTLYETESVSVLASPGYLARLNDPTPWTRRSLTLFRNTKRTACRVSASLGRGVGGALATLELGPMAGRDEELRAWLTGTALPGIVNRPGITGAHLGEADLEVSRVKTEEKKLRDAPDAVARWVVMVDGVDAPTVTDACAQFVSPAAVARHGAARDTLLAVYRLAYCLSRA
ncbi:MAG: hypothetical protein HY727_07290 [Candidatus Rokubacteria bacterium]|nr:hypothetical protein [Candidatus Rokubacteria bacterium]